MRDFRDAKTMAHSLRQALTARSVTVTHSDSLELVAKAFGFDNWNILAAKIDADRPPAPEVAAPDPGRTFYCSFCGKSQHEVRALIAGPSVFICDECVGLCDNIVENREIDAVLGKSGGGDAFAAVLELMRGKAVSELRVYRVKSRAWREHIDWSLRQTDAALGRLDTGAPWEPDATAKARGQTHP